MKFHVFVSDTTPKCRTSRKPVVPILSRSGSEHSTSARAAAPSANWPGKKFEVLSPISTIILLLPKKGALRSVTLAMRQLMGRRLQVVPTPSLTIGPQRFDFRADLSSQRTNKYLKLPSSLIFQKLRIMIVKQFIRNFYVNNVNCSGLNYEPQRQNQISICTLLINLI